MPHPLDVLRARQHRPDRRVARSGENSGPAVVDAAQERISGQDLSDQSKLRRYRRAEMLSVDRRCRAADRSCHRHHSGARGARRARAMRRRRRQERGDHLVGICRGGRRQRRHAGRHRRAGQRTGMRISGPNAEGFYQPPAACTCPTARNVSSSTNGRCWPGRRPWAARSRIRSRRRTCRTGDA